MPAFILDTTGAVPANTAQPLTVWDNLDAFTQGYIEALFFTECDSAERDDWNPETGSSLPADVGFSDLDPDTLGTIVDECAAFQRDNASDLEAAEEAGRPMDQCGHDFWLTRNGHGAGFWDRGLGVVGLRLTVASDKAGSADVYFGDDGRVYL